MPEPLILLDLDDALIADILDDELLARLARVGTVVRRGTARSEADVVVTGWGSAPFAPDDALGATRLIAHTAGTVRPFVPKSLLERTGVQVVQAPLGLARSVAELALWGTIGLLRSLQQVDRIMSSAHDWDAAQALGYGRTVEGAVVGVIGASRVGRIYLDLVRALGATVLVHDPYLPDDEARALGAEPCGLDDLIARAEVVSLHAPVTAETRGLLDARRFAAMRDGAVFVNTARSAIVDGQALERELRSGRLSALLDVFDEEPLPAHSGLQGLPNVILTPHIGAVTRQARHDQGVLVVADVERWAAGEPLEQEVTAENYDRLA